MRAGVAVCLLLAACFDQPSYEGRLCSDDDPCPGNLICVAERCSSHVVDPDAGVIADAALDAGIDPNVDGGADGGIADVGELLHAVEVSTRNKHDLLLLSDGTVWAWGWNEAGEVEGAPYDMRPAPVRVPLDHVTRVAAGGRMSFALTEDGTLYAWGRNQDGELGNGSTGIAQSPTPSAVHGRDGAGLLSGVLEVAAGYDFAIVLLDDGTVWGFGANHLGQLGRSDITSSAVPVQVGTLDQVVSIAAGAYHGVALRADHTVWNWGYNDYGQLGVGTMITVRGPPVQVHGLNDTGFLTDVDDISAGWGHTIAIVQGGDVFTWGWNASRQLGDGTLSDRPYPGAVLDASGAAPLHNIARVSAGFTYNLMRTTADELLSFGYNKYSQLGDGTAVTRGLPASVTLISGPPIAGVIGFCAGGDNALALTSDQTLWTWGSDQFGEQGNSGATTDNAHPFELPLP